MPFFRELLNVLTQCITAQKMKFSIKDFFSKESVKESVKAESGKES